MNLVDFISESNNCENSHDLTKSPDKRLVYFHGMD